MEAPELNLSFNIEGLKIAIGMPAYRGVVPIDTMLGILESYSKLKQQNISTTVITERDCSIVSVARDRILNKFLNETDADKLIWIDDDIGFTYTHLERVICLSTVVPVVCAVLPSRDYPTRYFMKFDESNPEFNEYGLLKIGGCGMGMVATDRSIYKSIAKIKYKHHGELLTNYFDIRIERLAEVYEELNDLGLGELKGEDYLFMRDLQEQGYPIYLDPLCEVTHIGSHGFKGNFELYLSNLLLEGKNGN